ncbi:outer membrane beta-barrel protein [Ancylobacter sp. A5.8]|uniref:outer membrane protein n=1 Tax=Ancylobacter gelatini TaxID=2919920 RepID=UPI001F4EF904|nr:outer membrane beta-barrel protein [Ancylobacter gelatini]MCJ8143049.1 outer membrane beta-barrel protein [Ancylobacter gelatini]
MMKQNHRLGAKAAILVAMLGSGIAGLTPGGAQAADVAGAAPAAAAPPTSTSLVPDSAFFIGAGASFNATRFSDQNLYAQGVSTISQNGVPIGAGYAGGNVDPGFGTEYSIAGAVQLGYFQHFQASDWLWGVKLTYNYLGTEAETGPIAVPQSGAFTGPSSASFTGNVVGGSYSSRVDNQFSLVPFLGRSFDWGFVYLGAGPTLSRVRYDFNNVVGFADINGVHYDITGRPDDSSSKDWVVGGEVIVGATYFLSESWFVDLSYSYTVTGNTSKGYSGPFSTTARGGFEDVGILSGTFSGASSTQSIMVSINRVF